MEKRVMAFGSFDIFHPGHLHYLKKAKGFGKRLIVVIARDESIRMLKHREPSFSEKDRASIVGSLKFVDKAVIGNKLSSPSDRMKIIKKFRPDVIVFGYDQKIDVPKVKNWLKKNKISAKVVRISDSLNTKRYKSSKIKEMIDRLG